MTTFFVPLALLLVALGVVGLVEGWLAMERGLELVKSGKQEPPAPWSSIPTGFGASLAAEDEPSCFPRLYDWQAEGWFPLHRERA